MALETVAPAATSCDWYDVPCNVSAGLSWFWEALNFFPRRIWSGILDATATAVESVPVPDVLTGLEANVTAWNSIAGIGYLSNVVALDVGAATVAAAMLARFLWSMIPVIGK